VSEAEVERRIERIAELIARGLYVRRATAKQLATEWGISKTTVEHYAAEARRLVNVDRGSLEEIRDDQLAKLDMIIVSAIAKKEFRTAVQGIETASRIAGTQAAQRHEVVASLLVSPLWLDVRARIMRALAGFPEARDAVLTELAAVTEDARRVADVHPLRLVKPVTPIAPNDEEPLS
jgi:hypothetical protein